jgi:hypothetical protein
MLAAAASIFASQLLHIIDGNLLSPPIPTIPSSAASSPRVPASARLLAELSATCSHAKRKLCKAWAVTAAPMLLSQVSLAVFLFAVTHVPPHWPVDLARHSVAASGRGSGGGQFKLPAAAGGEGGGGRGRGCCCAAAAPACVCAVDVSAAAAGARSGGSRFGASSTMPHLSFTQTNFKNFCCKTASQALHSTT